MAGAPVNVVASTAWSIRANSLATVETTSAGAATLGNGWFVVDPPRLARAEAHIGNLIEEHDLCDREVVQVFRISIES